MKTRRQFLRDAGLGAAALPFIHGLTSLAGDKPRALADRRRLIVMFTPNGTLPHEFWPDAMGPTATLKLKDMLGPLRPWSDRMLMLKGLSNMVGGDGDNHMRGMSCLLTATRLNKGNIQGGSHTPAGWAKGRSIDQEIAAFLQSDPKQATRFGSLEFGVAVPNRADPWTRMVYAGNNKPVAPIDDPGQMFEKLYGGAASREHVASILDDLSADLRKLSTRLSPEDKALLDEHVQLVRELERDIQAASEASDLQHAEPEIDPEVELINDNTPEITRMQMDLLVNSLANRMTRVTSIQFMRSVGQARMRWLDIQDGHHSLSHKPDKDKAAYEKLKKINHWFSEQLAYLLKRLDETPEPGGVGGSMLDHTQIVWLNELGKGNSHTLDNIPFVLIGGGCGFKTGRALDFGVLGGRQPHNRLWMTLAGGFGLELDVFGRESLCGGGRLDLVS